MRHISAYARSVEIELFTRRLLANGLSEYTMLNLPRLKSLTWQVDDVQRADVPGAFVECGTWRGGASFLMARRAAARGRNRKVWMFDSFEGLPPPAEIDGKAALRYASDTSSPTYFDNCQADLDTCIDGARKFGVGSNVEIVKGWFNETLGEAKKDVGPIAILRIDADWYESVKFCLEELVDQVSPGGFIVIDDYYDWDGCAIAVHEVLSARRLPYRIVTGGTCAYIQVPTHQ